MTQLTNPRVFEARYLCDRCKRPLYTSGKDFKFTECCECHELGHEPGISRERLDRFLPDAGKVKPIHLKRMMRNEPGGPCPERDGEALVDIPQTFVHHSPDGFEWGYGGSGPSDLALNILALFVAPAEAWRLHHYYKSDVIAKVDAAGRTIEAHEVRAWIEGFWDRNREEAADANAID